MQMKVDLECRTCVEHETITYISWVIIAISFCDLNHNNRQDVIIKDIISWIHNVQSYTNSAIKITSRGLKRRKVSSPKVLFRDNKVYTTKGRRGGFAYSWKMLLKRKHCSKWNNKTRLNLNKSARSLFGIIRE